jgi:4-hydroxy-tetrahydrodipicolinate synthase
MSLLSAGELQGKIYHGLIPAVPVPFTADGRIDDAAEERYVAYMAKQPIAGVAVWAHTGRGLRLTRDQRVRVLRGWAQGLGPAKVVIAGVGGLPGQAGDFSSYVKSALEMGQDAVDNGAQAFLIHPPRLPHYREDPDDLILSFHQQLVTYEVPVLLFYLYEAAGGVDYSLNVLRRLFALPQVAGIKVATLDSVMTFQNIANLMAKEFPKKLLITGEDRFLGYTLMCGAQGALIGMGAACCKLQHDLMLAYYDGRSKDFLELSRKVDLLSQVTFIPPMEGYIRRMLWALVLTGVIGRESAHDPWGPALLESEFEELGKTLRALGEIPAPAAS